MEHTGWLSIVLPLVAITTAVVTRHVYLSLLGGTVLGYWLIADFSFLSGLADGIDGVINVIGNW